MTTSNFRNWGLALGIDEESLAELERISSISIDEKTVRTDCLYSPDDIIDLWETDGLKIDPGKHGFVIVGGCANGDPIAISISAVDSGTVWYIDHERVHDEDLREIGVAVAPNISDFYERLCGKTGFPYDYHSALNGVRG